METTEKRVTNLRYLVQLSDGNDEFVREMVDIFVRENPKELKALEKGISTGDFDLIRSGAHRMKSTIPFVGIDGMIGRSVAEIEQMAKNHDQLSKIEDLFSEVKAVCEKAVSELNQN